MGNITDKIRRIMQQRYIGIKKEDIIQENVLQEADLNKKLQEQSEKDNKRIVKCSIEKVLEYNKLYGMSFDEILTVISNYDYIFTEYDNPEQSLLMHEIQKEFLIDVIRALSYSGELSKMISTENGLIDLENEYFKYRDGGSILSRVTENDILQYIEALDMTSFEDIIEMMKLSRHYVNKLVKNLFEHIAVDLFEEAEIIDMSRLLEEEIQKREELEELKIKLTKYSIVIEDKDEKGFREQLEKNNIFNNIDKILEILKRENDRENIEIELENLGIIDKIIIDKIVKIKINFIKDKLLNDISIVVSSERNIGTILHCIEKKKIDNILGMSQIKKELDKIIEKKDKCFEACEFKIIAPIQKYWKKFDGILEDVGKNGGGLTMSFTDMVRSLLNQKEIEVDSIVNFTNKKLMPEEKREFVKKIQDFINELKETINIIKNEYCSEKFDTKFLRMIEQLEFLQALYGIKQYYTNIFLRNLSSQKNILIEKAPEQSEERQRGAIDLFFDGEQQIFGGHYKETDISIESEEIVSLSEINAEVSNLLNSNDNNFLKTYILRRRLTEEQIKGFQELAKTVIYIEYILSVNEETKIRMENVLKNKFGLDVENMAEEELVQFNELKSLKEDINNYNRYTALKIRILLGAGLDVYKVFYDIKIKEPIEKTLKKLIEKASFEGLEREGALLFEKMRPKEKEKV